MNSSRHSPLGATADAHSGRETVLEEARQLAGRCAEGARDRDQRLRISRCQRSSLYLLAITFDRYRCRTSEFANPKSSLFWPLSLLCFGQAVVLATRPPISLKRTTVSPIVLEELLGEIGSLASVYHKPSETFIGRGRMGADGLRKAGECVLFSPSAWRLLKITHLTTFFVRSLDDEMSAREKALKTVAQGQAAENLLDFDDPISSSTSDQSSSSNSGLASLIMSGGASSNPATAKILTSSNPLDDLVSIFGNASMGGPTPISAATSPLSPMGTGATMGAGAGAFGGFGGLGSPATTPAPAQKPKAQDDLLDLF